MYDLHLHSLSIFISQLGEKKRNRRIYEHQGQAALKIITVVKYEEVTSKGHAAEH